MEKNKRYINQTIGIISVTANDIKETTHFKYYPEKIIKFFGFKIKVIPEHIGDRYLCYKMDEIPEDLKVIDGILYTKPHVWINYYQLGYKQIIYEKYEDALRYAQFIAFQHELVVDESYGK